MWILKRLCNPEKIYYLISEKGTYSVGRKTGDIVLDGDTSISRNHCKIKIAKRGDCPFNVDTPTGIWVIDENSKYGTHIKNKEWVKLDPNVVSKLENNAIVRFGVMENMFRVEYKPITVCTSAVSDEQKEAFKKDLSSIDGRLLNDFDKNCTLLIVNNVTLTKKVVLALIFGVPIVTPSYLKELVSSIRNQTDKPDYNNFKPEIAESALRPHLVSLDPKDKRKELFKGKIFMVPTKKQYDGLKEIIVAAGGKIEYLRENSNWDQLGGDNIIILKHQANAAININVFKKNREMYETKFGKRIIVENEIPQAIAYNSIEKFCNPKCQEFKIRRDSAEVSRGEIIESETPNFTEDISVGRGIVPSSSQSSQSQASQSQPTLGSIARKRDHSPDNLGSAKKRAIDENNSHTPDLTQFKLPAPKKQTSLLSFMSSKNKTVDKSENSNSPVSQSILRTSKLDGHKDTPRPTKRKADKEELPAARIEPSTKKTRVSTDIFDVDDEPSTSKIIPVKRNFVVQNNNVPLNTEKISAKNNVAAGSSLNSSKGSSSNSSSYLQTTVEDDNVEEWITCAKSEPKDEPEDVNTTVILMSLVSIKYTKENGSVIEPPTGLKNYKRFKKQKLLVPTNRIVPIEVIDDDDDDWSGAFSKPSQVY